MPIHNWQRVVRHVSGHQVVAVLEVVSPGNKSDRNALAELVTKAVNLLRAGIHLLAVDLFPPGRRDPERIHNAIWDEFIENEFALPDRKRLTLASYAAGDFPEAFVEPISAPIGYPICRFSCRRACMYRCHWR